MKTAGGQRGPVDFKASVTGAKHRLQPFSWSQECRYKNPERIANYRNAPHGFFIVHTGIVRCETDVLRALGSIWAPFF